MRKYEELIVDKADPFANDQLNREESATTIANIIGRSTQPIVMSIEAPWGLGKTTFIKMLQALLENRNHVCLYFNAWETDFSPDPLVPFIGEMATLINDLEEVSQSKLSSNWEDIKQLGGGILRKTAPLAIQIATAGLLKGEDIKEISQYLSDNAGDIAKLSSQLVASRIADYEDEKKGISTFREKLESVVMNISKGGNPPLIFFIDELDRCRPDYAVSLLERIKHLFNVKGIFFVLAIDRRQISESIKGLYGPGMDTDGYLRRFIDYSFELPEPSRGDFCNFIYASKAVGLGEFMKSNEGEIEGNEIVETFSELAMLFKFSLRKIEQCFTEMMVALESMGGSNINVSFMVAFLVAIKNHSAKAYSDIRSGIIQDRNFFISGAGLADYMPTINFRIFFDSVMGGKVNAMLIKESKSFNAVAKMAESVIVARKNSGSPETGHNKGLLEFHNLLSRSSTVMSIFEITTHLDLVKGIKKV